MSPCMVYYTYITDLPRSAEQDTTHSSLCVACMPSASLTQLDNVAMYRGALGESQVSAIRSRVNFMGKLIGHVSADKRDK